MKRGHIRGGAALLFLMAMLSAMCSVHEAAIGPAWTYDPSVEKPAGEKDMGTWTMAVYTPEQMKRLGVDESGDPVATNGNEEKDEEGTNEDPPASTTETDATGADEKQPADEEVEPTEMDTSSDGMSLCGEWTLEKIDVVQSKNGFVIPSSLLDLVTPPSFFRPDAGTLAYACDSNSKGAESRIMAARRDVCKSGQSTSAPDEGALQEMLASVDPPAALLGGGDNSGATVNATLWMTNPSPDANVTRLQYFGQATIEQASTDSGTDGVLVIHDVESSTDPSYVGKKLARRIEFGCEPNGGLTMTLTPEETAAHTLPNYGLVLVWMPKAPASSKADTESESEAVSKDGSE